MSSTNEDSQKTKASSSSPGSGEKGSRGGAPRRSPRRTWEEGYRDLKAFFEEHGHARPKAATLVGQWAAAQRKKRLKGQLSLVQIRQLNEIGYDWETHEEKLDRQWQRMFDCLANYKRKYGHTRVPQREVFEGESLGNWVTNQQAHYRNNKIKKSRKEQLERIGFKWIRDERLRWKDRRPLGKLDDDWNDKFDVLSRYKDKDGDTLVPHGYMSKTTDMQKFDLGAFVNRQRMLYRDGLLRKERREKLESINFVFIIDFYDAEASRNQKTWDVMFNRLCAYKEKHGDCNIPAEDAEELDLGRWARHQRAQHAKGELEENRFQRLDDLGFTWAPCEERWKEMVDHLRAYKQEHGDCKVPYSYRTKSGANLGSWVRSVRGANRGTRNFELDPGKIAELDALGFVWENILHLHWDIMYDALKRYKETHGHCRVPQAYKGDTADLPAALGQWVGFQRSSLENKLEATGEEVYVERKKRLDALGFEWSLAHIPSEKWDIMYERLMNYKANFGDCRVPYSYDDNSDGTSRKLGEWVYAQRTVIPDKAAKGNPIFVERKRRLDDIDFPWEDSAAHENWMKMFERLKQYHAENGHCRVPSAYDHKCEGLPAKLGNWVVVQKSTVPAKARSGHPVYVERRKLLDSIRFEYDHVHKARWEDMFERLKQYHAVHGNCRVPSGFDDGNDGASLSNWARNQRSLLEKVELGDPKYAERKKLLDTLCFEFDKVEDVKWMAMFEVLKGFKKDHGHCNVPFSYGDDDSPRALGRWCHEQRRTIPAGLKNPKANHDYAKRKRLLESVSFPWDVKSEKDAKWRSYFERLRKFQEKHGHCSVPSNYDGKESPSLYAWMKNQQKTVLSKVASGDPVYVERKRLLDSIGFGWKQAVSDDVWERMYAALQAYKNAHGHCRVPYRRKGAVDDPTGQLGVWVYNQRTKIPPKVADGDSVCIERKQRLDAIGFEWLDVNSGKWETMFTGLKRFHKEHGHCRVKRDFKDTKQPLPANLGPWVSSQRRQIPKKVAQGDDVAIQRKQRLDALGFVWQTRASPKRCKRNGDTVQGRDDSNSDESSVRQAKKRKQIKERQADVADSVAQDTARSGNLVAASIEGVPGPEGDIVAFPDYDGRDEPVMWKKAFGQFKRRLRKMVKESLDPSARTTERVVEELKNRWSQLSAEAKDVYRRWAVWDKMRYDRELDLFEGQKNDTARSSRKRRSSSEDGHAKTPKKKKKERRGSDDILC